ncbi:hypothetical protein Mgra_00007317 [Meloidogyne graminicola]|uniref:Uncharacterized protein n=1 Tax=Meloidogyne graminicola TaxID=189291 RepID=A0A8S9ZIX5_9BILA|nr:hypothetical protein Mgra_00007317 [Meloidogyne graminicola]
MIPNYFTEPNKFNPERFIEINKFGELTLKKVEAFLPFSIGKRQCLGESLARAELFFIFTYLIKNFKFLPESQEKLHSMKRIYGLTCSPQPFKCRLLAQASLFYTLKIKKKEDIFLIM